MASLSMVNGEGHGLSENKIMINALFISHCSQVRSESTRRQPMKFEKSSSRLDGTSLQASAKNLD